MRARVTTVFVIRVETVEKQLHLLMTSLFHLLLVLYCRRELFIKSDKCMAGCHKAVIRVILRNIISKWVRGRFYVK